MLYSKFTVSNFRCFNKKQELILGLPQTDKLGSGITYIVGANNTGKTTLIESMWLKGGYYLNDSEKKKIPPSFKFYSDNKLRRTVKLLRDNAYIFVEEPKPDNNDMLFEIISSRRHWEIIANADVPTNTVIQQSKTGENPRKLQSSVQIALFLKTIESDQSRYEQFTKLVQRIFPEFTSWAVGFESNPYIKYISSDGISHKADLLGDGVISIIRILAHLFEDDASGLIIDEPELSLHPLAQKRLIKVIADYAQKRQIVISTHSPYFISWEYIKNGAVLNRITKQEDKSSQIYTIKDFKKYQSLIKAGNWQQPFLMDEVSKEIFFQDNIIFTEGQEDVGLLKQFFLDDDINLFGYGVRGYGNFEFALQLAHDLGIKRACVFIDGTLDPTTDIDKNENAIKIKLESLFSDYKVIQWNKSDIRDKKSYNSPEKEGYFDTEGKIKEAENLDDFHEKIQLAKIYFKN